MQTTLKVKNFIAATSSHYFSVNLIQLKEKNIYSISYR